MKRSTPLARRTPLSRRSRLRSRPRPPQGDREARKTWKEPHAGFCGCECGRFSLHMERHHILAQEVIKREGRIDLLWDMRNGVLLSPICHSWHTTAFRRLPLSIVSPEAFGFAVVVLGSRERAEDWMARQYRSERA